MARNGQAPDGYKRATKAETEAYYRFVNTGEGEIAPGTVFDGVTVWVKDSGSTSSRSTESESKKDK